MGAIKYTRSLDYSSGELMSVFRGRGRDIGTRRRGFKGFRASDFGFRV